MQLKIKIPKYWPSCNKNNKISIITPAFGIEDETIKNIKKLLQKWNLQSDYNYDQLSESFLSKSDWLRLSELQQAINNQDTDFILSSRGGYGCARIIKELINSDMPKNFKLLTGFSDITTLHLLFNNFFNFTTLHSPVLKQIANGEIDEKSIELFRKIIFKEIDELLYQIKPLNKIEIKSHKMPKILGGNLTLIQSSIGTKWQINNNGQCSILIEEVDEEAYKIDRMLNHLQNAEIFNNCQMILIGDIQERIGKDNKSYLDYVINKFAQNIKIPTFKIANIGHGKTNLSIPLGVQCEILS